jgi:hypothetical protein
VPGLIDLLLREQPAGQPGFFEDGVGSSRQCARRRGADPKLAGQSLLSR